MCSCFLVSIKYKFSVPLNGQTSAWLDIVLSWSEMYLFYTASYISEKIKSKKVIALIYEKLILNIQDCERELNLMFQFYVIYCSHIAMYFRDKWHHFLSSFYVQSLQLVSVYNHCKPVFHCTEKKRVRVKKSYILSDHNYF